jgi:uncharacterized protein
MKRPAEVLEIEPGVVLDGCGGVFLTEHRTLVVADLHWGYSVSQRSRGGLFPVVGDLEIASRLDTMLRRHRPERLVWLGDSLHTLAGKRDAESWLDAQTGPGKPTIDILAGNHDHNWKRVSGKSLRLGPWFLHHGDDIAKVPAGCREIIGHFHPAVHHNDGAGTRIHVPALVLEPQRMILPALSPWAAGSPWIPQPDVQTRLWIVTPNAVFELPPEWRHGSQPNQTGVCAD